MHQHVAGTGRIERLSRGLCRSDDIEQVLAQLQPFVSGSLYMLDAAGDGQAPRPTDLRLIAGDRLDRAGDEDRAP